MELLGSQKGAALITALMLTALSLVIAVALLTMITAGTHVAASQKRYRNSLAAAQGGVDLFTQEILPRLLQGEFDVTTLEKEFSGIELKVAQINCLKQKLTLPAASWTSCGSPQMSADPAKAPDVTLRLAGLPPAKGFLVTAKILDTLPGNTDQSGYHLLDPGGAVSGQDEVVHPMHVPVRYNLFVQGEREEPGVSEKARLSVLYAY